MPFRRSSSPGTFVPMASITIHHNPPDIRYEDFCVLNDACFPHEPVGAVEFGEYRATDHWVVFDDEPIAFAVLTSSHERCHIRRIGVLPSYRRSGIASELMERMFERAHSRHCKHVDLLVQQDNPAAIELYRRYRFQIIGESVQFAVTIQEYPQGQVIAVPIPDVLSRFTVQLPEQYTRWRSKHSPPVTHVLILMKDSAVVGFTRFSPDFPGCSPFVLERPTSDIAAMIGALRPFATPDKLDIKVTTSDHPAIDSFRLAKIPENYSLYHMEAVIG